MRSVQRLFLLFGIFLVSVMGCKRDARIPELAPAFGVVTYEGEPLPGATVTFSCTERDKGYLPGIGSTNDKGEFRIRSYNLDGAVVGTHQVVIVKLDDSSFVIDPRTEKPVPKVDSRWKMPKSLIPLKYTHLDQSGLTAEVISRKKNKFLLELKDE